MMQAENDMMLPTHQKMGPNGKGERAMLLRHSYVKVIVAIIFGLAVVAAFLFVDLSAEQQMFSTTTGYMHAVEKAQRLSKLEAETKLSEVAGVLSLTVGHEEDQGSDLKLMGQHILYIQQQARGKVLGANLTDAARAEAFDKMHEDVKSMIDQHVKRMDVALATAHSEAEHVQQDVTQELREQEVEDMHLKQEEDAAMNDDITAAATTTDAVHTTTTTPSAPNARAAKKEVADIEARLTAVFQHVDELANRLGDTDIDALLESAHLREWEQILTDTESGKLAYPDGVKRMEAVLEKLPAALKLAEATGSIQLVEADGGNKGVTEVSNFRSLLREVRRLPQYAAVLRQLDQWKQGRRTVQQVLLWVQEQIGAKKLDGDWLARASAERRPAAGAAAA